MRTRADIGGWGCSMPSAACVTHSATMKLCVVVFLSLLAKTYCHPMQAGSEITISTQPSHIEVYKAGDLGYECFRIPSLLFTSKGTLLAFAEGRGQHSKSCADRGDVHVVLKRSTDYGSTWSDMTVVHIEANHTIGNPAPVEDKTTGKIILLFARDSKNILKLESMDDGVTWGSVEDITSMVMDPTWPAMDTGPPGGIQLPSGRLVICAYALEKVGAFAVYSDDGGKTWQHSKETPVAETNECQIAALGIFEEPAPKHIPLIMAARMNSKAGHVFSYSNDSGETWVNSTTAASLDPQTICESSLLAVPYKGVVMDAHVYITQPHSTTRENMTFFYSVDAGQTWNVGQQLWAGPSAYSSMVYNKLKVYCLYEKGNTGPYETLTLDVFSPLI